MIVYRHASDEEMNSIMDLVIRTFTGEQDIPADMNYLPPDKQPHWFCFLAILTMSSLSIPMSGRKIGISVIELVTLIAFIVWLAT